MGLSWGPQWWVYRYKTILAYNRKRRGVAQRLARHVRDVEAGGSNPLTPTISLDTGPPQPWVQDVAEGITQQVEREHNYGYRQPGETPNHGATST